MVTRKLGARGNGEMLVKGSKVSVMETKQILELSVQHVDYR